MSRTLPPYPRGRSLLAGKTVLITAAAGTGIGFATAKRCAEEGARVMLSDLHERRLREAAEQLEEQTVAFLGDSSRNWIDENGVLHLSKIFDWYSSDFTIEGSVVDWVRPYLQALPASGVKVKHADYDWNLNEASSAR